MTRAVTRTVYGTAMQSAKYQGASLTMLQYSTLNEWVSTINSGRNAMSLTANVQPVLAGTSTAAYSTGSYNSSTDIPSTEVKYLAIGNGGVSYTAGSNNQPPIILSVPHSAKHPGLYNQIPWVLRAIGNDLDSGTRAGYRHRVIVTINSVLYVAYFLKLMPANPSVQMDYVTVTNGNQTTSPLSLNVNDLTNPTPPTLVGGQVPATGDFLLTTSAANIILSQNDVNELLNVANILYGNELQSLISEIAPCTGMDKDCNHSWNGTTIDTTTTAPEATGVQVATFVSGIWMINYSGNGLEIDLNVGATEPLYGVQA